MKKIAAKIWHLLVPFVYIAAMSHATLEGFRAPYMNWDMIGYVASAISWNDKTVPGIYEKTMKALREVASDDLYKDIKSNPLSAEDKAFVEQLPIYRVKPLYYGLMWVMHETTGMGLPKASWVISATCFGLLSVLLYFWRPRYMAREIWLLLIITLTYAFPWPMTSLACLSTPDCIATLLILTAFFSWFMRHSFKLYCAFSWIAIFARPDALLPCSAVAAYCALFAPQAHRMPLKQAAAFIVFSSITYFTISRLTGNYGLERWFIYAFIDKTPYPAEATDRLTLERYWNVLSPSTLLFLQNPRNYSMCIFSTLACFSYWMRPADGNRFWLQIMGIIWLSLTVRFLMFPAWGDDRYYFVYYLPILFAGGELISAYTKVFWKMLQEHRKRIEFVP